jgi:ribonuclease R
LVIFVKNRLVHLISAIFHISTNYQSTNMSPGKTKEDRFQEQLKREILEYLELNDDRAFSVNQIIKAFAIRDRDRKVLVGTLSEKLVKELLVKKDANGHYRINSDNDVFTGTVDHVNAKFAFIRVPERESDIYVEAYNLRGAIDGDQVKVHTWPGQRKNKNLEGEVVEIITSRSNQIVGTLDLSEFHGFVTPVSKKLYSDIFIPNGYQNGAEDGDKVVVEVYNWATATKKMEGRVIDILGKTGENNAEMHAILAEFGLPYKFDERIEAEAEAISDKLPKDEIKRRLDLRGVTTFTIDPVDAKDFDDALSIEFLENDHVKVGVHIADVSYYVRPGTLLEEEALKRATSVYLVDRTIPMLPEKLSNNLCSLRPKEDKFTFSAMFTLDQEGKIINEWFGRTVTHSQHRFAYEQAQEVLDGHADTFKNELITLNTLAKKLRNERFKNGSVNFETVEVKFKLDENGVPLGIVPKVRVDAHKLIEEFMLLANKRVAEFVFNQRVQDPRNTMVYRVHEQPNPEKVLTFAKFAQKFGHSLDPNNVAASLNKLMESVEGKPEQNVLETLAVRTMAKARYTTNAIGHFGLAFPFYSHFTSPIRRYPDVMAHRMLQHYLDGGANLPLEPWESSSRHSSEREKLASEAERASIKYKQVEFMSLQESGLEYDGIVSGVTDFGLFVEIKETGCEGLVRMTDLTSDYFEFDAENFRLVGRANGKVYTFGDAVRVKVKECNMARRSMDLYLLDQGPNHRAKSAHHQAVRETFGRGGGRVTPKKKWEKSSRKGRF